MGLRLAAEGSIVGGGFQFGGRGEWGTGAAHAHTPVSHPLHGSIASPTFTCLGDIIDSVVRRPSTHAPPAYGSIACPHNSGPLPFN
jgi:hypothetical protein